MRWRNVPIDAPVTQVRNSARKPGAGMAEHDADAAQLAALGYTAKFDRSMSVWENFALGFTYLSPVVGVYSVFAVGITTGGPPMFWSYFLAGAGQIPRLPDLR